MAYNLSPFLFFFFFFYSKFLLIGLLQFFFIKYSNNFFTIEIVKNICPWNCLFNFTINKNFFIPVWCVSFSKNIFVFRNSYVISNLKFRIFIINFFLKINICIIFNITGFILIVLWYVLLYSPTVSSNLSIYTLFDTGVMYL